MDINKMSYDELMSKVREKFKVDFEEIGIGNIKLSILSILNLEDYIDRLAEELEEGNRLELPFWAKIWPTSILLGYVLLKLPHVEADDMLEIGAGMGLCGLVGARRGFNVIISDIDEDSLIISRINILKNHLLDKARVEKIDFTKDRLNRKFKYIIGSEVLYKQEHYRPLIKFFLSHTNRDSSIILAKDYHLKAKKFFKLARDYFEINEKFIGYREMDNEKGEKHICSIIKMRRKG